MLSPEQRFKNFLDEKYHMYDNADAEFYRITSLPNSEKKRTADEVGRLIDIRKAKVDKAVEEQIRKGKVLNTKEL